MDTISLWINTKRETLLRTLRRVDVLFANDEEVRMLTDEKNLVRAGKLLLDQGPSLVVAKKGEHGALLFGRDFLFGVLAFPSERVLDPTGAGDTFAGAFLGFLDKNRKYDPAAFRKAAVYGNVLASFVIEDFSIDRLKTLTREEIEERFHYLTELVSF
jgi:sugar/nucleoside kinase (ribokinase family)